MEVANDLTAETFAQALVSVRRFSGDDDSSAAAWLYAIARHLLARYWRTQRVESAARHRLGLSIDRGDEYAASDERLDAGSLAPRLHAEVAALPGGERDALNMRVIDGYSYAEVGDQLAISEPAARMRVFRALRTLQDRLKGDRP